MNWFKQATGESFSPSDTEWRNQAEKTFKPATANRRISSLKAFFAFALDQGLATDDPPCY